MKKWWQSKTIWANATAVVGALGAWAQTGDVAALAVAALGLVNLGLRKISGQPIE